MSNPSEYRRRGSLGLGPRVDIGAQNGGEQLLQSVRLTAFQGCRWHYWLYGRWRCEDRVTRSGTHKPRLSIPQEGTLLTVQRNPLP
jgi:hypothetical protein